MCVEIQLPVEQRGPHFNKLQQSGCWLCGARDRCGGHKKARNEAIYGSGSKRREAVDNEEDN